MERMPESVIAILEMFSDDPDFSLQNYAARCLREAHAEIDRLNVLVRDGECRWALDDADGDYNVWITDCGNAFIVIADGPEDNEMRYCPFCGKTLVEIDAQKRREDNE